MVMDSSVVYKSIARFGEKMFAKLACLVKIAIETSSAFIKAIYTK